MKRVVVVGKIIIDEYRSPDQKPEDGMVSVGGGGPQAAFGAAAALAILSEADLASTGSIPPKQRVTLVGAVGGSDWTETEETALRDTIGSAIDTFQLVKGPEMKTPRIQLWHDKDQNIQWRALNDSFGSEGADGLWDGRPSAPDILESLQQDESITCHVILEGSSDCPGSGRDSQFLADETLRQRVDFLGVEPVVFADERTGKVKEQDARASVQRLEKLGPWLRLVSPDRQLHEAIEQSFWEGIEIGLRLGPRGSLVGIGGDNREVPAARLVTPDGSPVNPTGAGNAYSAALTACRGAGLSLIDAACVASAIGAVMCEYDHIPPYSQEVLTRIREALQDIRSKLGH